MAGGTPPDAASGCDFAYPYAPSGRKRRYESRNTRLGSPLAAMPAYNVFGSLRDGGGVIRTRTLKSPKSGLSLGTPGRNGFIPRDGPMSWSVKLPMMFSRSSYKTTDM